MAHQYRREGGTDGSRRQRPDVSPDDDRTHAESDRDEDEDAPRTSTRTEQIDREEGIQEGDETEMPPAYRQALIEFVERRSMDDDILSAERRAELLREGCQIDIEHWDLQWHQQDEE